MFSKLIVHYGTIFIESRMGNGLSGSPLTQVLVYALLFKCPNVIDLEIIQLLSDMNFDMHVVCHKSFRSPIELAIDLRRFDIVQLMVTLGAHPIDPCISTGEKVVGVIQLLEEYYEFGTNHYILWLLHEHLLSHDLPGFMEAVVKLEIFDEDTMKMFGNVGRHPAHAILTCGHEDLIKMFIERHGHDLLTIKDGSGMSALEISAERGDLESVKILVNM